MNLRQAYDAIASTLLRQRVRPDSIGVVREVESLRSYWKPEVPRVILLAESHVRTREEDFRLSLDTRELKSVGLENYPSHFVRFIYCLGAGERDLLPPKSRAENRSKWQFWRLLWSCRSDPGKARFDLTRQATPDFRTRLRRKVQLLQSLKANGVWLLDASIIGINGLPSSVKREVTMESWEKFVGPRIESLSPGPTRLVVVGKAVAQTVFASEAAQGEWQGIPYEVVNQPQGDRTREQVAATLTRVHRLCAVDAD